MILGRADATITLASPLLSRRHLRLFRRAGAAFIEDLHSHNGTWLAGARISAPIPVGNSVDLLLGKEIACSIGFIGAGSSGGLSLDVAGERWLVPLGPLLVDGHACRSKRAARTESSSSAPARAHRLSSGTRRTESRWRAATCCAYGARRLRVIA